MNYTPSGYPSSYQSVDVMKYASGQPIHDNEHLPQIARLIQDTITNEVPQMIKEQVPPVVADIMRQIIPQMIDAMRYDITTIVSIAFEQADSIWQDKRTQTYITDNIMKSVEQHLNDITLTVNF